MARIDLPEGPGNERQRVKRWRPAMAHGVQAFNDAVYQHSSLPLRELEAVRFRVAMVNACPV
jgi:hypothetical protein